MGKRKDCPFCNIAPKAVILKNNHCFAIFDKYPVNPGHILIIPYRHTDNYFSLTKEEKIAIVELIDEVKRFLDKKFSPDGYNIGVNVGKWGGQTIMHVHIHVIPRYKGDTPDPTGGVRGVIPEKSNYLKR